MATSRTRILEDNEMSNNGNNPDRHDASVEKMSPFATIETQQDNPDFITVDIKN